MNSLVVMMSLLSAVSLTAAAVSVLILHRAHRTLREANRPRVPVPDTPNMDIQELRDGLAALATQVHEMHKAPPVVLEPGLPKPGLNLNRRSQALRMHRRGDTVEQIATALALPRQEIELLLKVHRIVLNSVAS